MATNDFQAFGNAAGANVLSQADYLALAARLSGFTAGTANSAQLNKVWRQSSVMAYVLAQFISDTTRQDVLDNGAPATILAAMKSSMAAGGPSVGASRNVSMAVSAASATATITADEIAVKTALGGSTWLLPSFSKTINIGTTGAGGMDTGSAPANGFVAIYAIFNPTTGVSALLGVNATSAKAPEVYGGANMPAGYTASALVSVWPTASSLLKIGAQTDRRVDIVTASVLNSTSPVTTLTALAISTVIPLNARVARLSWAITQGVAGSGNSLVVSSSSTSIGAIGAAAANTSGTGQGAIAGELEIIVPQTIYYTNASSVSITNNISVLGYYF
ncbi:hypothetical protein [Pseudomonas faucium]|uniref:hypothetical protein n=1 Tax=Pseudomonas faucium TaxID=2740518 RepID=UPI001F414EF3|nr:hypothetical protein [Pseudomonas faucium]